MSIVTEDCLIGHFNVSLNKHEVEDLENYILRYEKKYLFDLLGPDFYALLKADLTAASPQTPQNTPWSTIFDCFQYCTPCGQIINCDGLKDMLTGFIYYHWISEQWKKHTASGTVVIDSENSTVLYSAKQGLANYWNDAVANYLCIQAYICDNLSDFEDSGDENFTGIRQQFMPLI